MGVEQPGIKKVILYENINVSFNYPDRTDDTLIDLITTSGETIEIEVCENKRINLTENWTIGRNRNYIYERDLEFIVFGTDREVLELLGKLSSRYGYIALLYYNNNTQRVIEDPLVFNNNLDFQSNISFSYVYTLSHESSNDKQLRYQEINEELLFFRKFSDSDTDVRYYDSVNFRKYQY